MLKNILIAFICSLAALPSMAQRPDTARLYGELRKLYQAYSTGGLRYDFRYTFAAAHRPERILDSLSGSVEMSAAGSRMVMGNMEFITNPRYAIVIFKEDKLMYLYKPGNAAAQDPLSHVRQILESGLVTGVEISKSDRNRRLGILFDSTASLKSIELNILPANGLLSSVRYLVRSEMIEQGRPLTEKEQQTYGPLAMVDMYFLRYGMLPAAGVPVHESAYFTIEEGEFTTTPAFRNYEIFKGSPNL